MTAKKSLATSAARRIEALARAWMPTTRFGDCVCAWLKFFAHHGRVPGPGMRFNDYLYRLKTTGEILRLPRQIVSDKEHCKAFVDAMIGPGRTIPTIAVLHEPSEVDSFAFPDDCVIKPTHLTKKVIMRRNGEEIDLREMKSWFRDSLAIRSREENYRYLVPKIIVEPIVFDGKMIELKIHCWKGRAKLFGLRPDEPMTIERRDRDWNMLPIRGLRKTAPEVPTPRPDCLDEVIEAADRLSRNFEYIRVDVYVAGREFLIGELTNVHRDMRQRFASEEDEALFSRTLFGDDFT